MVQVTDPVELQYNCIFCATPTNFQDSDKAYCIDCYIKLRNSAHTHETRDSLPQPLKITPMPFKDYLKTRPYQPNYIGNKPTRIIC